MNSPEEQEQATSASRNNSSSVLTRRSILQGGSSLLLCNQGIARAQESTSISKYAGKILFSNNTIVVGKENPSAFKNSFTSDEYIYATAYFSRTLRELNARDRLFIYGQGIGSDRSFGAWDESLTDEETLNNSYFYLDISPRLDDPYISKHFARKYAYSYFGLAPGVKYRIAFNIYGSFKDSAGVSLQQQKPAATGIFTFVRREADDSRWRKQQQILDKP